MRWFVVWKDLRTCDPNADGCEDFMDEDRARTFMATQESKGLTCLLFVGMPVPTEPLEPPAEAACDWPEDVEIPQP
jgi:hypothetical protein